MELQGYDKSCMMCIESGVTTAEEEDEAFQNLDKKEQQRLEQAARKYNANMAPLPGDELARQMRKRGVSPALRAAMCRVKCPTCQERQRPEARPVSTSNTDNTPRGAISMDIKE